MPHDHAHGHAHGHGHHHHAPVHEGNERRTLLAAVLTGGFMVAEVIGGVLTGSLALIADAGHMLTDFAALALAWWAFRLARRPATPRRSYGLDRFQVLVAFTNGVTLAAMTLWITIEAIGRLANPEPVLAGPMMAVAALGLLVNIACFAILHGADRDNLNIRGAAAHVMGDLLGSVAALAAGAVIYWTGFLAIDPILSLLIAGLIAVSAVRLMRDSGRILLEAAPEHLDPAEIGRDLPETVPGVESVHHVHVWCLTQERVVATLHACLDAHASPTETVAAIKARLKDRFGVGHVTVEIETETCADTVSSSA